MQLKASALASSLFFMIIVGVIISVLLTFSGLAQRQFNAYQQSLLLKRMIESGLTVAKADQSSFVTYDPIVFNETDSLYISKYPWNCYQLATIKADTKNNQRTASAFLGFQESVANTSCLAITESTNKLQLIGNVVLKGDLQIGGRGYERGNLGQSSVPTQQIVEGNVFEALKDIPQFNNSLEFFRGIAIEQIALSYNAQVVTIDDINSQTIVQSFQEPTLIILITEPARLANIELSGNIIVYSTSQLQIDNSAIIKDCWIIAPEINTEDNWSASVHLLANHSVEIGENNFLAYPSSIVIKPDKKMETLSRVFYVNEGSIIEGSVLVLPQQANEFFYAETNKNAIIEGELIVDGKLSHYGKVYGNIIAKELYYKLNSGIYKNYLIGATIDKTNQNPYFVSAFNQQNKQTQTVIKWLE